MGLMLLGEANGEAPAQAELHLPALALPTCAWPATSKRPARRMGLCVNLHEHWQVGANRPMTRLKAMLRNIGS
jgi:hypothetical protein